MAKTQTSSDPLAGLAGPPAQTNTTSTISQPIGVPYYQIDPSTGQPFADINGQPSRWSATRTGPVVTPSITDPFGVDRPPVTQHQVLPRYFDGAQWLPASLPPAQLASLQKAMVQAGLLKSGQAQLGVWDSPSLNAYTQLLSFANASGLSASEALGQWGSAHQADPNAGRAPLTIQVDNPDDLRATFRKAVIDTLGQGWDQAKIDSMVTAYQAEQTRAQTQAYGQQETGGTVTAPPTPADFAATQARAEDPASAQEHDALGFIGAFKDMVGGWQ